MVKDGYKKTEAGVIPEEWQTDTFQCCFDTLPNNTLSRAELNYNGGTVKNIHYGDVLIKFPAVTDCQKEEIPYVNRDCVSKLGTVVLHDKDVIIADTAEDETVGKATELINVGEQRIVSGLHTIPCRPKQPEQFAPKWLGYFINHRSYHNQLLPLITGTKVSSVSKSAIADTVIVIPERNEQERIVDALSDIDELILSVEKLIAKKKDIRNGAMQELLSGKKRLQGFGDEWQEYMLGDECKFYGGGTPSTVNEDFWNGDIPWISSSDITADNIFSINITRHITTEAVSSSATQLCPANCILVITRVGVGKLAVCNHPICTSQDFLNLQLKRHNATFVAYKLLPVMKELAIAAQGTSIKGVSSDDVKAIRLILPPKEEQDAIVELLHDMDLEIANLQMKLEKYKKFKIGMMDEL